MITGAAMTQRGKAATLPTRPPDGGAGWGEAPPKAVRKHPEITPAYEPERRALLGLGGPSPGVIRAWRLLSALCLTARVCLLLVSPLQAYTSGSPVITRGPYLQQGSSTNIIVRWRTDAPTESVVRYGARPDDLDLAAPDAKVTAEHEVRLTGLSPDTKYFYSVGTTDGPLAGDDSFFFITSPTNGRPTRLWVIGDSGTANDFIRSVHAAYTNYTGVRHTDLWLMLGDNAYTTGADLEYQAAVFDLFPRLLRQTVLWTTIGNHDPLSGTLTDFPYLHIFSPPENGEAGGVPSRNQRYYSFDYGNVHFVSLDSTTSDRSSNGPMCNWLRQDLAVNRQDWLIAFWHHPPYSRGGHDSDGELDLAEMRQNFLPLLETHGVDLVLTGHSHSYERSFFLNGHYGLSTTFDETLKVQPGSGRTDDTGAYTKPAAGPDAERGTVYVVAGSTGQGTAGPLDHPAMFFSELKLGSVVLDIDGPVLEGKFLRETGDIDDSFTIIKGEAPGALRILSHQLNGSTLTIVWTAQPGKHYHLESATDLSSPNWMPASGALPASSMNLSWSTQLGPDDANTFYRVVKNAD
jgi:hypothetical protein